MRSNRRIYTIIMAVLAAALLLPACQPTPDEAVVINKGDGKLVGIIAGPTASQQTIASKETGNIEEADAGETVTYTEHWKETYTLPYLTCEIDADVILPVVNEYPVFKVQQRDFDTAALSKIVDYFTKDAIGVRDTSDTKEELENKLIMAKRGAYVGTDGDCHWEPYEGQAEDIAELEGLIAQAQPEAFDAITKDAVSIPIEKTYALPNDKRIYVNSDSKYIDIYSYKYGVLQPESWIVGGEGYPGEPAGTTINNIKINEEEAKKTAKMLLSDLGIKNFGIAKTEKARIIECFTYDILSEGWQITFARNDGRSIPVYIDPSETGGLLYSKSDEYISQWLAECLTVYVDENGIQSFHWEHPTQVVETMNGNVPIKGLDEIKEKIRDCLKYSEGAITQAYMEEYGEVAKQEITLNKVVLTNVLIAMKDEPKYHMLVPAWVVYYEQEYSLGTFKSVIAINAIDGSNIDLEVNLLAG